MGHVQFCQLCGRQVGLLTRHHLIPRTRHANKRNKRDFERKEVKHRIAWLCPLHIEFDTSPDHADTGRGEK